MDRQTNRYEANCLDCRTVVAPEAGRLYRHSGSNMTKHMARRRGARFAFAVRCDHCYRIHDKIKDETVESSGIAYSGYGANTHAICGN